MRENSEVKRERAVLAGVDLPEHPIDYEPEPLEELKGLADTAGAKVLARITQKRLKPDQTTYIGRGKLEELEQACEAVEAELVIFDHELEPAQVRNIEKTIDCKVVDRTELILDIFAARAHSSEARLQVELAQLEYLRPRLRRMWTHLERHGGGIGTRGPGEQQLETDRRLIDKRIKDLRDKLKVVQQRREREVLSRADILRVSLVGYTNAGKSTLMRRLTGADVLVANKLFSTLETRTRQWTIPQMGRALLSDTVGFIRNLPHDLVASFKATLEEAVHAHLLLHVVDAANPQPEAQIEAVNKVLEEIGVQSTPTILVFNQIDRVADRSNVDRLEHLHPRTVAVSARTGEGIDELNRITAEMLAEHYVEAKIRASSANGKLHAYLSAHGKITRQEFVDDQAYFDVKVIRPIIGKIRSLGGEVIAEHPPAPHVPTRDDEFPVRSKTSDERPIE